jgi:uncharacterized protein
MIEPGGTDRPGGVWTYTGKRVWVEAMDPAAIDIRDIARSLAFMNRYFGHTKFPYSVAQHSVLVSRNVPPADALAGLLHDSAEAYMGDCIRPVKYLAIMSEYRALERMVLAFILGKYGLGPDLPASVKVADERITYTEFRDVRGADPDAVRDAGRILYTNRVEPYPEAIEEWDPYRAEREFLARWAELGGR